MVSLDMSKELCPLTLNDRLPTTSKAVDFRSSKSKYSIRLVYIDVEWTRDVLYETTINEY